MTENKFPTLPGESEEVKEPTTDITVQDLAKIQEYAEAGLPGLAALTEPDLARALELYLGGKTYHQISRILRVKRDMILYLSHKFNWYPLRKEVLNEMEHNIRGRVVEAKISSQNFLLTLTNAWEKKISSKIEQYLRTGDSAHMSAIDIKEVDKYLKTLEMLLKISDAKAPKEGGNNDKPTVGLNLGDGVTVKKVGDNEVEITPKAAAKSLLSQMAEFRREQERSKAPDIKKKPTQGENNETE